MGFSRHCRFGVRWLRGCTVRRRGGRLAAGYCGLASRRGRGGGRRGSGLPHRHRSTLGTTPRRRRGRRAGQTRDMAGGERWWSDPRLLRGRGDRRPSYPARRSSRRTAVYSQHTCCSRVWSWPRWSPTSTASCCTEGASDLAVENRIRRLRFEHGEMSQRELASRIGVTRQTVNAIEGGKYSPSLEVAFRIAGVFGVSLEAVFSYRSESI